MGKNIVICSDGTNNEIAGDQTNVLRLFRILERSDEQAVFYDAGVGTNVDPTAQWAFRRFIQKKLDGAIGLSIRSNVLDAYRFLMDCYEEGDRIYLFGFSRGAYTVRALAGMLHRCGLLYPSSAHLAQYAWSVFTDEDRSNDGKFQFGGPARIKKVFSREVPIHFIGVWDTVSCFGWIWDMLTVPNTDKMPDVAHVRHALSLDERRSCFEPSRVEPQPSQDCKEVWFGGVHADVGGGYPKDDAGMAAISLYWMLSEAVPLGLKIKTAEAKLQLGELRGKKVVCALAPAHDESKKTLWKFQGWFPKRSFDIKKKDDKTKKNKYSWFWPNWAGRRTFPKGCEEMVHDSVEYRVTNHNPKYVPNMPKTFRYVSTTQLPDLPWDHKT